MENIELLRSELMQQIFATNNLDLLKAINHIFNSVKSDKTAKLTLTETQKEMLLLAEEDIQYGRTISDEELRKLDEEWMK